MKTRYYFITFFAFALLLYSTTFRSLFDQSAFFAVEHAFFFEDYPNKSKGVGFLPVVRIVPKERVLYNITFHESSIVDDSNLLIDNITFDQKTINGRGIRSGDIHSFNDTIVVLRDMYVSMSKAFSDGVNNYCFNIFPELEWNFNKGWGLGPCDFVDEIIVFVTLTPLYLGIGSLMS